MPVDPAVLQWMEAGGIDFEEMACDPHLADTAAFCEAYGVPLDRSANTILVASRRPEGRVVACLVLATTRLDVNGLVRQRMAVRKASFADAETTRQMTGMEIGGVTAFGLPPEIPVWVDSRVLDKDWVVIGAGTRTAKIRLDPSQFEGLDGFEIVEGLGRVPTGD
jgi:prolyl-tRNA editing enzyme YbaK/EbsC (Cys-tRNA(Pro) deacylase)